MPIKTSKTKGPSAADKKTLKAAVKDAKLAAVGKKGKARKFPAGRAARMDEQARAEHEYGLKRELLEREHALALQFEAERNKGQVDAVTVGMKHVMENLHEFSGLLQNQRAHSDPFAIVITGAELREQFTAAIVRINDKIAEVETYAAEIEESMKTARTAAPVDGPGPGLVGVPDFTGIIGCLREKRDRLAFQRDHLAVGPEEKVTLSGNDQEELRGILTPREEPSYAAHGGFTRKGRRHQPPPAN